MAVDALTSIEQIATLDGLFKYDSATHAWQKIDDVPVADALFASGQIYQGTAGADNLAGSFSLANPYQVYHLGEGNDTIHFLYPNTPGKFHIVGGDGNDTLKGNNNGSYLDGGRGNDTFTGGNGNDIIRAGAGNDIITGGDGNDTMWGGAGADVFNFSSYLVSGGDPRLDYVYGSSGNDVIRDFELGIDKLHIAGALTTNITDGLLVTSTFKHYVGGPYDPSAAVTGTILLEGVHGTHAVAELFI